MKDSNNIIEITPSFIFFNFRGNGCYVSNSPKWTEMLLTPSLLRCTRCTVLIRILTSPSSF